MALWSILPALDLLPTDIPRRKIQKNQQKKTVNKTSNNTTNYLDSLIITGNIIVANNSKPGRQ